MNQSPMDDKPERVDPGYAPPPDSGNGKSGRMAQILLIVVISVAVCFLYTSFFAKSVKQSDFDTNLGNVAKDISVLQDKVTSLQTTKPADTTAQLTKDFATLKGTVDALDLRNYVKVTDLQTEVTKTVQSNMSNLANNSTVQTIQSQVKTLSDTQASQTTANTKRDADIKALQDKVTALETQLAPTEPDGTVVADGLSVTVKDLGTQILAGAFGFNGDQTIKLTVKNDGTKDITDLRVYVSLIPEDYNLPTSYIDGNISLGGDLAFTLSYSASDEFEFKSPRISIAKGKVRNYYLTPSVNIKRMSIYPFIGNSGAPALADTGVDTPYAPNPDYFVSKLQNDLTFYADYAIIDYNVN